MKISPIILVCFIIFLTYSSVEGTKLHKGTAWRAIRVRIPTNRKFFIVNVNSGKALDVYPLINQDGVQLAQRELNGDISQQWFFKRFRGGYSIRNVASNMVIDLEVTSPESGIHIIQAPPQGTLSEVWQFLSALLWHLHPSKQED